MLRLILYFLSFYLIYEFWLRPLLRTQRPKPPHEEPLVRRVEDWKDSELRRRRPPRQEQDTEEADYEEIK
jgi:hypothetical protein